MLYYTKVLEAQIIRNSDADTVRDTQEKIKICADIFIINIFVFTSNLKESNFSFAYIFSQIFLKKFNL